MKLILDEWHPILNKLRVLQVSNHAHLVEFLIISSHLHYYWLQKICVIYSEKGIVKCHLLVV